MAKENRIYWSNVKPVGNFESILKAHEKIVERLENSSDKSTNYTKKIARILDFLFIEIEELEIGYHDDESWNKEECLQCLLFAHTLAIRLNYLAHVNLNRLDEKLNVIKELQDVLDSKPEIYKGLRIDLNFSVEVDFNILQNLKNSYKATIFSRLTEGIYQEQEIIDKVQEADSFIKSNDIISFLNELEKRGYIEYSDNGIKIPKFKGKNHEDISVGERIIYAAAPYSVEYSLGKYYPIAIVEEIYERDGINYLKCSKTSNRKNTVRGTKFEIEMSLAQSLEDIPFDIAEALL
jgi:hypothetical protein